MITHGAMLPLATSLVLACAAGCSSPVPTASAELARGGVSSKKLDIGLCAPTRAGFTLASTNPYFPLIVGHQLVLSGEDEGDEVTMVLTVLDVTRVIEGVTTRVVEEREFIEGELAEVTWNYHVEAVDGTVCYYGEDVDVYTEEGITHDGAWCPGGGNLPGIFMPADPRPGMKYQNEVAPGIAEDEATIVGQGPHEVPFGAFADAIRILERNPLDGGKDFKIVAAGTGFIVDGILELIDVNQTSGAPDQPTLTSQVCGSAP